MGRTMTAMGVLADQQVEHLIHFTRIENLRSILRHGLLSRERLAELRLPHVVNDDSRFDGMRDAVCLSVSFPNYRMFYAKRRQKPETDWVVLRLKPELVANKRCAFSPTNAASSSVSSLPLTTRMSPQAVKDMFQDRPGVASRAQLGLARHYTTDPQAEILVLDAIAPEYITDVLFDAPRNWVSTRAVDTAMREVPSALNCRDEPGLFRCRADYKHWEGHRHG